MPQSAEGVASVADSGREGGEEEEAEDDEVDGALLHRGPAGAQ
jgi:hypothetical protein